MNKTTQLTFNVLQAVSDGLLLFEINGRYRHVYMNNGMDGVRRLLAQEEARAVRRRYLELRKQKLIREKRRGNKVAAALTERGNIRYFGLSLRSNRKNKVAVRLMVAYDIPENVRRLRDALRYLLKSSGFRRVQQSVWVIDRDVKDDLLEWTRRNRLGAWVRLDEIR